MAISKDESENLAKDNIMNNKKDWIAALWHGTILILAMCMFPPWNANIKTSKGDIKSSANVAYSFFLSPPKIGDTGKGLKRGYDISILREKDILLLYEEVADIDYPRLLMQCSLVATVTFVLIITIRDRNEDEPKIQA